MPDSGPPLATTPPAASTLPDLLDMWAAAAPEREALVTGRTHRTYAELAEESRVAARALASLGVGADDVVALMAPNVAEWIPAAFGAMRCGARVDAFNTWVKAYDLDHLLGASAASVLILSDWVRGSDLLAQLRSLVPEIDEPGPLHSDRFPALRHVVVIGETVLTATLSWAQLLIDNLAGTAVETPPGRASAIAYVLYTSGSTSKPKAVPLCHRNLIENAFHIGERMGLRPDDRVWFGSPLFWSYGCANALLATMTHGACFVLQEQFSADAAATVMAQQKVTAAYLLPAMIDALTAEAANRIRAIPSLRTGLTIGRADTVRSAAVELDVPDICNIYGSTETYGNCCVTDHRLPLERRQTCQGAPLPGMEVRIVDETGAVLPADQPGEAQVRGRITPGYLGDDAANTASFTQDGWLRTGDRMTLNGDGTVTYIDRMNDMIKTSGINVSPAEVESFLQEHPDVRDVLVVGAPHPSRDEVAVAFILSSSDELTEQDVVRHCKERIAGYKVPWLVTVVPELPRTGTGKIARRLLRDQAATLVTARLAEQEAIRA